MVDVTGRQVKQRNANACQCLGFCVALSLL